MANLVGTMTDFLYNNILVFVLIAVGLSFTVRLKGVQLLRLGDAVRVLKERPDNKKSISSLQMLFLTVGAKVGAGNIVGVASALCLGGRGAVFWMWVMAILGGAVTFVETTLGQIYKRKSDDKDGTCYGGPAFYMQDCLNLRWLGVIYSVFLFLIYAVGFNMVCSYNMVDSFSYYAGGRAELFSTAIPYVIAAAVAVIVGICVLGGGRRLAKINSVLAPAMSVIFLLVSLIVVVFNISSLPIMFGGIFRDAFDFQAIFGGFTGSCLMMGIKRSVYSNEAGTGSAPNAASSVECSHPVKQGLVQILSVFIDTLVICTATAMLCLFSGIEPTAEIAGIGYVQAAAGSVLGQAGYYLLTISIALFCFTSMIGNLSYCSSAWKFIFKNHMPGWMDTGYRLFGAVIIFLGAVAQADLVWNTADFALACMCVVNLPIIVILSGKVTAAYKDYCRQKKEGKDPVFKASEIGIEGTDFWN